MKSAGTRPVRHVFAAATRPMRGSWTIALREILDRRMLLLLAVALGLLAVLLPLLPFVRGTGSRGDTQDLLAEVIATALTFGLAILLGASVVGQDLSEGRLGFYFVRPAAPFALWAGKFAGAFFIVLASGFLAMLPATLAGGGFLTLGGVPYGAGNHLEAGGLLLAAALASLFVLAVAHVLSILARVRSPWVLADLVMLGAVIALALFIGHVLIMRMALGEMVRLMGLFAGGSLLSLLAAGAAQVCVGRTDIRRGHRGMSVTLWGLLLLILLALGGRAAWYVSVSPEDLIRPSVIAAPAGGWMVVGGQARRQDGEFHESFLMDATSRKSFRTGTHWYWSDVEFSRDGRAAAWCELSGWPWNYGLELVTARLGEGRLERETTGIRSRGSAFSYTLSDDGRLLCVLDGDQASVIELSSHRSLGSVKLPGTEESLRWWTRFVFLGPGKLRFYLFESAGPEVKGVMDLAIVEWDLAAKRLETTGRVGGLLLPMRLRLDQGQQRLLLRSKGDRGYFYTLRDARTGALIRSLDVTVDAPLPSAAFLADGRIAAGRRVGEHLELDILSGDGTPQSSIPLGDGRGLGIAGQPTPSTLILWIRANGRGASSLASWREDRAAWLVDLAGGTARKLGGDLAPALLSADWYGGDMGLLCSPGAPAARLFWKGDDLVSMDVSTGTITLLLKGKAGARSG